MPYEVKLVADGDQELDWERAETDQEMFAILGRWSVFWFLALDSADYKDARWGDPVAPDSILRFTCDKQTDSDFEHGRRHGFPKGVLAKGSCWEAGHEMQATIAVARKE